MNELFKMILSLSVSGSLLALVVWGVSAVLKNRLSFSVQYLLWLIVVLRLVLPLSLPLNLVNELFQNEAAPSIAVVSEPVKKEETLNDTIEVGLQADTMLKTVQSMPTVRIETVSTISTKGQASPVPFFLFEHIGLFYLVIAAVLLIYHIIGYRRYTHYLRSKMQGIKNKEIDRINQAVAKEAGVKMLDIRLNPLIRTPMVMGLIHPVILLNCEDLSKEELRFVLLHEYMHIKRGDLYGKWLVLFVRILHWFNPFVYLIQKRFNQIMETACDEKAVRPLDEMERRQYGSMLIASLSYGGSCEINAPVAMLSEEGRQVKTRLNNLLHLQPQSKKRLVQALAVLAGCAVLAVILGSYCPLKETKEASDKETLSNVYTIGTNGINGSSVLYQRPYLFELLWTDQNREDDEMIALTLEDMTIKTEERMAQWFENEDFKIALCAAMESLQAWMKAEGFQLNEEISFVLAEAWGPYQITDKELAYQLLEEDRLSAFQAVVPTLKQSEAKEIAEVCYEKGKGSYFSALVNQLDDEQLSLYLERSFMDDRRFEFSCAFQALKNPEALGDEWLDQIISERKDSLIFAVAGSVSDAKRNDILFELLESENDGILFTGLYQKEKLSQDQIDELGLLAIKNNLPAAFGLLAYDLSEERISELALAGYDQRNEKNMELLLTQCNLNEEIMEMLAEKAYQRSDFYYLELFIAEISDAKLEEMIDQVLEDKYFKALGVFIRSGRLNQEKIDALIIEMMNEGEAEYAVQSIQYASNTVVLDLFKGAIENKALDLISQIYYEAKNTQSLNDFTADTLDELLKNCTERDLICILSALLTQSEAEALIQKLFAENRIESLEALAELASQDIQQLILNQAELDQNEALLQCLSWLQEARQQ